MLRLKLWPPDVKDWLIGKEPDAGEDWRQEEKGTTEDELVGWHHRLDGHELEQAPGVGDGQGSLASCSSWGRNGSDTERLTDWQGQWQELVQESDHWLKNENHTLVSAPLWVPKARRKCSSAQRKKGVAFNGTTLRAGFQEQGSQKIMDWHL